MHMYYVKNEIHMYIVHLVTKYRNVNKKVAYMGFK